MTHEELRGIIEGSSSNKFKVTYSNGSVETKRMFISDGGFICEYIRKSKSYGYPIHGDKVEDIVSVYVVQPMKRIDKIRKTIGSAIRYLNESKLWSNVRIGLEKLYSEDDEVLQTILDKCSIDSKKYGITIDAFYGLEKGIKYINYDSFERKEKRIATQKAIQRKEDYSYSWRNGYDCNVEIKLCNDGEMRGWYSEEYKGCLNGHYYFMLDEKHALFCEND